MIIINLCNRIEMKNTIFALVFCWNYKFIMSYFLVFLFADLRS